MVHERFATTTRGLDRASLPMRLFEKAKRFGVWNPSDIDFSQDRADWLALAEPERDVLLRLTSIFQAGEEAVTLDLLPLVQTVAREGRLEEELYLTTFLFEEAKHTDFFRRVLDEVAAHPGGLDHYAGPHFRFLVYDALPRAMQRLVTDQSPAAQIEASATYNMIVEGVLAETGYHAYFTVLERRGLMPGVRQGVTLLKQDESRHIAYGLYLISRLVAADPRLWDICDERMGELLPHAIGVVGDVFAAYDPMPFGLVPDEFLQYAMDQFGKRLDWLKRALDTRPGALAPDVE
jgi:ribonucleoside-diphosphate reductase beta chain